MSHTYSTRTNRFIAAQCFVVLVAFAMARAQGIGDSLSHGQAGSLRGQVVTADGTPVSNLEVELRSVSGRARTKTIVDSFGNFAFSDVPTDAYDVVVGFGVDEISARVYVSTANPELILKIPSPVKNQRPGGAIGVSELIVPQRARDSLDKALKAFTNNKRDQALKELNKALQIWPRYSAALTLRGFVELDDSQLEQARNDFNTALSTDPAFARAHIGLAAYYNRVGQFDSALKLLERSKPYTSGMWQLHFEKGKSFLGLRAFENALKEANEASQIVGSDLVEFRLLRAEAYLHLKQTESAVRELRECLARENKGPRADVISKLLDKITK